MDAIQNRSDPYSDLFRKVTTELSKKWALGVITMSNGRLIEVPVPGGAVLFLTPEEYAKGLKRGKRIRRAASTRERVKEKLSERSFEK